MVVVLGELMGSTKGASDVVKRKRRVIGEGVGGIEDDGTLDEPECRGRRDMVIVVEVAAGQWAGSFEALRCDFRELDTTRLPYLTCTPPHLTNTTATYTPRYCMKHKHYSRYDEIYSKVV